MTGDGSGSASATRSRPDPLSGEPRRFVEAVRRHDARLRRLAARMLPDRHTVDDVLQDAYIRAFRALPNFRHDSDTGTWLHRIVYNACVDELRRSQRRPAPIDPTDTAWHPPAVGRHDDRVVTAEVVRAALAALPADQRAAVALVDGEGFDYQTAAEILGVAPGTVASRLSRARAVIRHRIGEDNR